MCVPEIEGVIRRRLLINFRAQPEVVQQLLPATFAPKVYRGWSIVGICLIRLEEIRPVGFPRFVGMASDNAAHRIAVTWQEPGDVREGVYIPRRDTNSCLNHLAGGRLFPGEHNLAEFHGTDDGGHISISIRSSDGSMRVEVEGQQTDEFPSNSIFPSLTASSEFFAAGSVGYSATRDCCRFDGIRLDTTQWTVAPLCMSKVESSFFGDRQRFPANSIEFDHALIMRDIPHRWVSEPEITSRALV
ncbi:MAG: DUF2071 domain-containing protein [Limisphaerales bacterium]